MRDQSTEPPVERRVAELARRQHGVVAHGQLLDLALSASRIGVWSQRGWLHRVHQGVYAVGHLSLTRNGRFMAAVLACGEGAALSHFSAAVLWQMLNDRNWPIHVTPLTDRRRRGIRGHQAPLQAERVRLHA